MIHNPGMRNGWNRFTAEDAASPENWQGLNDENEKQVILMVVS